jgi:putative flippase GtrA
MELNAFSPEVIRFGVVGFASNLVLYLVYLGLTKIGLRHKFAMSILYVVVVLQTFVFNNKWTFRHYGHQMVTFTRYISLYAFGYLINLAVLIVMVDHLGYSHERVQGVTVLVLALLLCVLQKAWGFCFQGINGT